MVRSIGMLLNGQLIDEVDPKGVTMRDDVLLLLFNAYHEEIAFTLPGVDDGPLWHAVLDTAHVGEEPPAPMPPRSQFFLQGRSLAVLSQPGDEWAARYGRSEAAQTPIPLAPFLGGV